MTHIHGEGVVTAILAPNRYRRLYSSPEVRHVSEVQDKAREMQLKDFPDLKDPLGLGLCTCWEPIVMWRKDADDL